MPLIARLHTPLVVGAVAGATALGTGFSMEGPGSIVEALAVLASIVAVHECGHFFAARIQNIHVSKFSIGFGPALFTIKGKAVEYSLRAIPLGGYVAFPDDDPKSTIPPDDPNLLKNKSIASRCLVISAGVVANVLFALVVLFTQVETVGKAESQYLEGVRVSSVTTGSASERAGIMAGDIILTVNGKTVTAEEGQVQFVVKEVREHALQAMPMVLGRGGSTVEVQITAAASSDGSGRMGAALATHATIGHVRPKGVADALAITGAEFSRLASNVGNGLARVISNPGAAADTLSGPVAIVAAGSEIARTDSAGIFQFCALLNINLAFVNILPLPGLDGAFLMFLFIEAVRGKKLPEKLEQGVMASGLLLLTTMGALLVVRDTVNLFH